MVNKVKGSPTKRPVVRKSTELGGESSAMTVTKRKNETESSGLVKKKQKRVHTDEKIAVRPRFLKLWDFFYDESSRHFHGKVKFWSALDTPQIIKRKLTNNQLDMFKNTPFGHFIEIGQIRIFSQIIHQGLVREVYQRDNDELWFEFGERRVRFGLPEFCLLTGLNYEGDLDLSSYVEREQPIISKFFGQMQVTRRMIDNMYKVSSFDSDDEAVTLSVMYLLFNFLLAGDVDTKVDRELLIFVSMCQWENFPWGRLCYDFTVKSLSAALKGKVKKVKDGSVEYNWFKPNYTKMYKICGFAYAFQVFLFESIPTFADRGYCVKADEAKFRVLAWTELDKSATKEMINDLVFGAGQFRIEYIKPLDEELQSMPSLSNLRFIDGAPAAASFVQNSADRHMKVFRGTAFNQDIVRRYVEEKIAPIEAGIGDLKNEFVTFREDLEKEVVTLKEYMASQIQASQKFIVDEVKRLLKEGLYVYKNDSEDDDGSPKQNGDVDGSSKQDGDVDGSPKQDGDGGAMYESEHVQGSGPVDSHADASRKKENVKGDDETSILKKSSSSDCEEVIRDLDIPSFALFSQESFLDDNLPDSSQVDFGTLPTTEDDELIYTTQDLKIIEEMERSVEKDLGSGEKNLGRGKRVPVKSSLYGSPFTTDFGSGESSDGNAGIMEMVVYQQKELRRGLSAFPDEFNKIPLKRDGVMFTDWFKTGYNHRKRSDKFPGENNLIDTSMKFGVTSISNKMWFYALKTPNCWLDHDNMEMLPVVLYYNGLWLDETSYANFKVSGILIPSTNTLSNTQTMVRSKLKLNISEKMTLKFQMQLDVPPIDIDDDRTFKFYIEVCRKNSDYGRYPLIIECSKNSSPVECTVQNGLVSMICGPTKHGQETPNSAIIPLVTETLPNISDYADRVADYIIEQETKKKMKVSASDDQENVIICDASNVQIRKNQSYINKATLTAAANLHSVRQNRQHKVLRSSSRDLVLVCKDDKNCKWKMKASTIGKSSMFKVRDINDVHTCSSDVMTGDHRQATTELISECIKSRLTNYKKIYTPSDIVEYMMNDFNVSISYQKAWRSKERALQKVRGDPHNYSDIPSWLYMLEKKNSGTKTDLKLDWEGRFKYLFFAMGPSIEACKHCFPIIVIDGTLLKSTYMGTLLTASAQDANKSIVPIAFAVVDNETEESWTWFFRHLRDVISDRPVKCIVSDVNEGILKGLDAVFPDVSHGASTYHVLKNIKNRYKKSGDEVRQAYNGACGAYTMLEFNRYMAELDRIDDRIRKYLEDEVHLEKITRLHGNTSRYSTMTSNIAESMNNAIRSIRELPTVTMIESLRCLVQRWYFKNKENALSTFSILSTDAEQRLEKNINTSKKLKVETSNLVVFTVYDINKQFVVDISKRTCTCEEFQYQEMPCPHAAAVLNERHLSCYDYCSPFYSKTALLETYKTAIMPLGDIESWDVPEDIKNIHVLPPCSKRPPGRPKSGRYKSVAEEKVPLRCSMCHEKGHNKKTCTIKRLGE